MKNIKEQGQVYTPIYIVKKMLDIVNYNNPDIILNKKIMEPSFGTGVFLKEIFSRILSNFSENNAKNIIQNNVFGIEKDYISYKQTLTELTEFLKEKNIDLDLSKNLILSDTLTIDQFDKKIDIVIGNPPYVNVHNIKSSNSIKKDFHFAQNGMMDLYIVFFEKGLQMLTENGKLCYITPNSYFTSCAGKTMRKYIVENKLLSSIIDFGHKQIFENVTTYTCITTLDKSNKEKVAEIVFENNSTKKSYEEIFINNNLYMNADKNFKQIIMHNPSNTVQVKNGFATLNNTFFIDSELSRFSKYTIPACKSSTGKFYSCFYPYRDGKIIPFKEIEKNDKETANYLLKNKDILLNRALTDLDDWYGFGRTQGISDVNINKFAINNLYKTKKDIKITECKCGTGIFSGLYIITKLSLNQLTKILQSDDFINYISILGHYKSGGYYTVTSKELQLYISKKESEIY